MEIFSLFKIDILLSLILIVFYCSLLFVVRSRNYAFATFYFSGFIVILFFLSLIEQQLFMSKFIITFLLLIFLMMFLFNYTRDVLGFSFNFDSSLKRNLFIIVLIILNSLVLFNFFNLDKLSLSNNIQVSSDNVILSNNFVEEEGLNLQNSLFFDDLGAVILVYIGLIIIMLFFIRNIQNNKNEEIIEK